MPQVKLHVHTSGVWRCVYLMQFLWIPGEIKHTYSILQHNHYPVWGKEGGGGGDVSVFIDQTSDSKPMECVNYRYMYVVVCGKCIHWNCWVSLLACLSSA